MKDTESERVRENNSYFRSKECLMVKPSKELNFQFNKNKYSAELSLLNKTTDPVLFKIRTTASKSYLVLPTAGLIPPGEIKSVKIFMPIKEQVADRAEDKFLVQAFECLKEDLIDEPKTILKVFDQYSKSSSSKGIQNIKFKVHFEIDSAVEAVLSENNSTSVTMKRLKTLDDILAEDESKDVTMMQLRDENANPSPLVQKISMKTRIPSPFETLTTSKDGEVMNISPREMINRSYNLRKSSPLKTRERIDYVRSSPVSQNFSDQGKVNKDLRTDFEGIKKLSLPHSSSNERDYSRENDVSRDSLGSNMKSYMSSSKPTNIYKQKFQALEKKYYHQKILLAQIKEEKNNYRTEINTIKLSSLQDKADDTHQVKTTHNYGFELWQLLLISILFLIIGSFWK